MTDHVDSYLKQSRQDGQLDSKGSFTLDINRARDKLNRLRLEEPSHYLLKFVQGAVQARAHSFQAEIKPSRVVLRFHCPRSNLPHLTDILRHLHEPEEMELSPARNFAIGLAALMYQNPGKMIFSLATRENTESLCTDSASVWSSMQDGQDMEDDAVTGSLTLQRGSRLWPGRKNRNAAALELVTLERCRLAPLDLTINRKTPKGWPTDETHVFERQLVGEGGALLDSTDNFSHCSFAGGEISTFIPTSGSPLEHPRAYLLERMQDQNISALLHLTLESGAVKAVIHGVMTPFIELPFGLKATVQGANLSTDLSGLQLIQDDSFDRLKEELKRHRSAMRILFLTYQERVARALPKKESQAFRTESKPLLKSARTDQLECEVVGRWQLLEKLEGRERFYRAVRVDTGDPGLLWVIRRKRYQALLERWAELDLGYGSPIFLAGEVHGGEGYLATEAAGTLAMQLEYGVKDPLNVVFKVGEILCRAHSQGMFHCDVQPDSILFDESGAPFLRPPVRFQDVKTTVTAAPSFSWLSYFAPEQIIGSGLCAATDQFGLASLCHHLLAGTEIFAHKKESMAKLLALIMEEPEKPETLEFKIWSVLSRAFRKDPDDRFANLQEMLTALRTATEYN
jgi:hypothetical protein